MGFPWQLRSIVSDFVQALWARRSLVTVAVAAVASVLIASSVGAAPERINKAPNLPTLPTPPRAELAASFERAIPAAGSATTGLWITLSRGTAGNSRTRVKMPPAPGTALMADWNGDGVATPGVFDGGQWSITNAAMGRAIWESFASFGSAGDIPLTGQRDGDGKADIATFRDGIWNWRDSTGSQEIFEFGEAGDVPVVGDWNGDGIDEPGVVRGATWIVPRPNGQGTRTFSFGQVGDVPIAGDWDGDGKDGPGVVRGGQRWFLAASVARPDKTDSLVFKIDEGERPLVGLQTSAPGACPTATTEAERFGKVEQRKVQEPLLPQGTRLIPGYQEINATLRDGMRNVMVTDLTSRLRSKSMMPYYDPLSSEPTKEGAIRRSANAAFSAAILYSTSGYIKDNRITRDMLLDYARWHIRSIACAHGAISPGGWGNGWQSALWAVVTGQAAWMLWDELSLQERAYVASMVYSEAEFAAERGPRYFRDRIGLELTPGNSMSDEVSWDLLAPALAYAMFPGHQKQDKWRNSMIAMGIAAFARPSNLRNNTFVNGISVSIRLPGTNANEDGTVTNHGIVNPDYTQNVQHLWWAATLLRAGSRAVPEAIFLNADIVYRALAVVNFPSPPYAPPGGTVYAPGGQIYYPMGKSWGVRRPATFVGVDAFANVYAAPDTNAGAFLAAHAYDTRALQLRFQTGQIYAPGSDEESYRLGKEEYALQQVALAWWAGAWKQNGKSMSVDRNAYPWVRLHSGYALDEVGPFTSRWPRQS